eukprot:4932583-Pyramimonas_sp.AAC.1
MCGQGPSTLPHRPWHCQACAAERVEVVSKTCKQYVDELDTDNPQDLLLLLTRAVCPHSGDLWPRPGKERKTVWPWEEGVTGEGSVVMGA